MREDDQLTAMREGREEAWNWAIHTHAEDIYGLVYHLVGNRGIAEDLSQDVWMEAVRGFSSFDAQRGRLRDWLLGIARRRVALHFRRAASRPILALGESTSTDSAETKSLLPAEMMEQGERASVIRAAWLMLETDRREVLRLKYLERLPVREIAQQCGKTPKAVESLLARARDQLRQLLSPYFTNACTRDEP